MPVDRPSRICVWCGQAFTPPVRRGPPPRYCRPSHRRRAYEARRYGHPTGLTTAIRVNTLSFRAGPVETACICTTLRMASRSTSRLYDRVLSEAGLRASRFAILSVLGAEGPLSIGELAGRLTMDRTTCTREVAPLVSAGLVGITVSSDRRRRLAQLTSLGQRKRSEARSRWEHVQQMLAADLGDEDVLDLLARLRRLLASSEQLNSAGPRGDGGSYQSVGGVTTV
ncbi:MAG: MarR family winged helix-turn-helix transcriptional regulator [Acidimicrobiales bacterium]